MNYLQLINMREICMDVLNRKKFLEEKIEEFSVEDNENDVAFQSFAEKFLRFAVNYVDSISDDLNIDNYESGDGTLGINGYYENEDEQEFHILLCLYYPTYECMDSKFIDDYNKVLNKFINFVIKAEDSKFIMDSESVLNEAITSYRDAKNANYKFCCDLYTNIDIPNETPIYKERTIQQTVFKRLNYGWKDIYEEYDNENAPDFTVDFFGKYGEKLYALKIFESDNYDIYLSSINARTLAKVYEEHKNKLLESNVRSFLKRTVKVNKGISLTIKDEPENFAAYNNGLSTIAFEDNSDMQQIDGSLYEIYSLNKLQIVNGGQTTVTIFECSKDPRDLSKVIVPMKIAILKNKQREDDLVSNISKYANTQTAIAKSDLCSNDPFYKSFYSLSKKTPSFKDNIIIEGNKYFWYFERTNGQYNTESRVIYSGSRTFPRLYPKNKKFNKKLLAKVIMSWSQDPISVCMGNEKNFDYFNKYIKENNVMPNDEYFKNFIGALILYRTADKIILNKRFGNKAAVLPYTIAKLSYCLNGELDLISIFDKQDIDDNLKCFIESIASLINDHFLEMFNKGETNILMYGRKKQCWENIKNIYYEIPEGYPRYNNKFNFLPKSSLVDYFNSAKFNHNFWDYLIDWSERNEILNAREISLLKEVRNDIQLSSQTTKEKREMVYKLFKECVSEGFDYNDIKS